MTPMRSPTCSAKPGSIPSIAAAIWASWSSSAVREFVDRAASADVAVV
jgi:hypothetical protein